MMRYPLVIACLLFVLASRVIGADIPPLSGNVSSLREPPENVLHGTATNGLTLGLWSEKQEYELNSRMNVWTILSNTNRDASGRAIPYDRAIHKDDYLTITDEDGKQTKIKGEHPFDGLVGLGFMGGISAQLHENIRRPGRVQVTVEDRSNGVKRDRNQSRATQIRKSKEGTNKCTVFFTRGGFETMVCGVRRGRYDLHV